VKFAPAIALALAACAPNVDLVALGQKPDAGDPLKDAGVDTASADTAPPHDTAPPPPLPRCSPIASSTITLIDQSWTLYAFDPATTELTVLGQPICLQKQPGPLGVSVAVEPNGNIWLTVPESMTVIVDRATNGCAKPPPFVPVGADAIVFGRVPGLPDSQADDLFVTVPGALLQITPDQVPSNKWPLPGELMPPPPPAVVATGDGHVFLVGATADLMLGIGAVYAPTKVDPPSELKGIAAKEFPPTAIAPWKADLLLFGVSEVRAFHPSSSTVDAAVPLKTFAPIVGAGVSTCAWP
jgi:hypothetical protein